MLRWTKSGCVLLALIMLPIAAAAGGMAAAVPAWAGTRIPSGTQVTTATAPAAAASVTAAHPAASARYRARYVIRPGDTLSAIAARFAVRGGWPALYAANRAVLGPDPGLIRPGTVHRPAPAGRPAGKQRPAGAGMPRWLTLMLLAAGALIAAACLAEPFIAAVRKRLRRRPTTAMAARPSAARAAPPPAPDPAPAPNLAPDPDSGPDNAAGSGPVPGPWWPWQGPPGIVVADYDRLVVTHCQADNTIYVLHPPGTDPGAILEVARLVLAEDPYQALAAHLGLPASWPIG